MPVRRTVKRVAKRTVKKLKRKTPKKYSITAFRPSKIAPRIKPSKGIHKVIDHFDANQGKWAAGAAIGAGVVGAAGLAGAAGGRAASRRRRSPKRRTTRRRRR